MSYHFHNHHANNQTTRQVYHGEGLCRTRRYSIICHWLVTYCCHQEFEGSHVLPKLHQPCCTGLIIIQHAAPQTPPCLQQTYLQQGFCGLASSTQTGITGTDMVDIGVHKSIHQYQTVHMHSPSNTALKEGCYTTTTTLSDGTESCRMYMLSKVLDVEVYLNRCVTCHLLKQVSLLHQCDS